MGLGVLIQLIMVQTGSVFDCLGAGEAVRGGWLGYCGLGLASG